MKSASKNVPGADQHDRRTLKPSATVSLETQDDEEELLLDKEQQKLFPDETKSEYSNREKKKE